MRILIVKTSSLGDVVRVLPALTDASLAIPGIEFDWVVEEAFAEIPKWHATVKNVIPIAWRRLRKNLIQAIFSGELVDSIKLLRQKEYDLIIDAQGLIKSAVITKLARGVSLGYDRNSIREKLASCFYDKKFNIPLDQHSVYRMRKLFSCALNYEMPDTLPDYDIKIDSNVYESSEKYIVFIHGTTAENRCWSEQKWIDLAQFANLSGYTVYLPWGNTVELERAKRIAAHNEYNKKIKKVKVLPKLGILDVAKLLQNAACAVSVDTGLGHIAAALKVPLVSLYGSTIPRLAGTVGPNQRQIVHLVNLEQLEVADVWNIMNTMVLLAGK